MSESGTHASTRARAYRRNGTGDLSEGSKQWIRSHYRIVKHLPLDGPFTQSDLPDAVDNATLSKMSAIDVLIRDCTPERPRGYIDVDGTRRSVWRLHPDAIDVIKETRDKREGGETVNGAAPNPLPCDCPVAAFLTHAETIECKECGQAFRRDTLDPVEGGS